MKADEIRELTLDEIQQKLDDAAEELFNLRYRSVTAHLENPKRIREVKKDVARLKTIMREKQAQA